MRERLSERVRQFRSKSRPILSNGSVVVVLLILTVGAVGAQSVAVFEGDFEDGTSQDWVIPPGDSGQVEPINGEQMLWPGQTGDRVLINQTTFNTTDGLRFEGRLYAENDDSYIFLQVNDTDLVQLSWFNQEIDGEPANLTVGNYHNFTLIVEDEERSLFVEDNGWYNDTVSQASGELAIETGGFQIFLSEYYVVGGQATTPTGNGQELELDTRDYIMPNESAPYSVHFNDSGEWSEVTDNATVTSNNTSVLTVNAAENLLEGQEGVNTTVNVTAEYTATDGTVYQTTKTITVATATVDNLEILPAIWRFGATIGDDTIFFLIIAMLTGIVGTRLSTAFGGISLYWVVVMIGWFSGWLSLGILLVTTAMSVFIGLNLALTIDYGMRPGQG